MRSIESPRTRRRRTCARSQAVLPALVAGLAFAFAAFLAPRVESAGTPAPPKQEPKAPREAADAPPPDSAAIGAEARALRSQAEESYAKGYAEAQEAKGLEKAGKDKDAKKKFGKALGRFQHIVESYPQYYEAWNMLGFCARKTGDLKRAFDAYQKCLAINPEYEEAHEYLGEAHLMAGNIAKAKEQLAWLKTRSSDEAAELEEAIAKAEAGGSKAVEASSKAEEATPKAEEASKK